MDLKPIAEFAIKHTTAPENLIKWVSDGNYLNWEVKDAFCVPRDNALVFATQAELDAFIRWLRTGDRDENAKELAAALRKAYARKNGDHRKHVEVIKLLATDWCSGIDLLRLKLDIAEGREKKDEDSEDGAYGCYAGDFKSGSLNSFFSALDYYPARDFSNEKQHAMVYRDMLAVMETMQLTGKRATGVVLDDLATRCMEDEPGPEDARFGKHDDQADALRHWRDVLNPPKHIDDTPARVETVYYNPPGTPTPVFGEPVMSTTSLSFTTVNYVSINGNAPIDLSKLPADNIFSLIEQTEAEIKRLNEISNKPKALVKRIDDLQAGIDRLVAEIDGRDA